jgi:transcription elongation factor Elf1
MYDELGNTPFNLRLVQRCPVCKAEQASAQVEILEEMGASFLAYLSCARCGASLIVRVMTLPQGLVGNAILTDLTAEEVLRFASQGNVAADDVLDVWQSLSGGGFLAELGPAVQQPKRLPPRPRGRTLPEASSLG